MQGVHTARDFGIALRDLLRADVRRTDRPEGWAPSHTKAANLAVEPGQAIVQRALGHQPVFGDLPPAAPRGVRPIYPALTAYALARAGCNEAVLKEQASKLAQVQGRPTIQSLVWSLTLVAMGAEAAPVNVFEALVLRQRPGGQFLDASPYDSPDLHWYDELVTLHALASYHALRPSPVTAEAIQKAALYHMAETQPDHATTQPWALHAFGAFAETRPLADLLLHGTFAQNAGRLDGVARLLVADAVLALT